MTLIDIKDIQRKDSPVHYRNEYNGTALFDLPGDPSKAVPVNFSIEHTATGTVNFSVTFPEHLDYPLLPLKKSLMTHVKKLYDEGSLS